MNCLANYIAVIKESIHLVVGSLVHDGSMVADASLYVDDAECCVSPRVTEAILATCLEHVNQNSGTGIDCPTFATKAMDTTKNPFKEVDSLSNGDTMATLAKTAKRHGAPQRPVPAVGGEAFEYTTGLLEGRVFTFETGSPNEKVDARLVEPATRITSWSPGLPLVLFDFNGTFGTGKKGGNCIRPGAAQAINTLQGAGFQVGIWTNSMRKNIARPIADLVAMGAKINFVIGHAYCEKPSRAYREANPDLGQWDMLKPVKKWFKTATNNWGSVCIVDDTPTKIPDNSRDLLLPVNTWDPINANEAPDAALLDVANMTRTNRESLIRRHRGLICTASSPRKTATCWTCPPLRCCCALTPTRCERRVNAPTLCTVLCLAPTPTLVLAQGLESSPLRHPWGWGSPTQPWSTFPSSWPGSAAAAVASCL